MLFPFCRAVRPALALSSVVVMFWPVTLVRAQAVVPAAPASAPAEATLPAISVKGAADEERANGPVDGYRARRSATATKTDTPLNEVPQSISVITADQIRDQNAQTMQEVLRYSAGVRAEMYGLDNRGDWFSLRGGSEGSVLLDGLRVPLTGYYGVVRNEPYAFERVEVLRGPASVIAGQNGPGGVVNMVSKRPQAEAMREVQVQLGNDKHKQASADLTGPLNADGSLLYRLVALEKDSGTQVQHADDKRTFVAPSLTWKPRSGTSLTVYAEYQKDTSGNTNGFFPIEGTLTAAPNGFIPVDTFVGEPAWDRYGGERKRVGYEFEQQLGDQWTLRHRLRHDRVDGGQRSMYATWWLGYANATGAADPNGRYLNRLWYATDDSARITNADLLFEGKLAWGGTRHTLLVGADFMTNANDQRYWDDDFATPLNVYDPVYGSFAEPATGTLPSNFVKTRVRNLGLLVQDQVKIGDDWIVVAGLRHDKARTETDSAFSSGATASDRQADSANSKNVGVVYRAGAWSPYLNYSESFEPVAGADFEGAAFKPKRGKQVEAGVKWAPSELGLGASAAVYQLKEANRLTTDPDSTHTGFSVQRGEVTVKGLELELNARLRAWDLIASYTYMDARQTKVSSSDAVYLDKQLSGIPKHSASAWAVYTFGGLGLPGLRAGAGVRYVGKSSDGIDLTITPSTTLLDLMLAYDTGPWRLALNVANATDKTYLATCLERGDCWFGSKRKAIASVAYRW
jgi:iron complex outermembrane receptor protein